MVVVWVVWSLHADWLEGGRVWSFRDEWLWDQWVWSLHADWLGAWRGWSRVTAHWVTAACACSARGCASCSEWPRHPRASPKCPNPRSGELPPQKSLQGGIIPPASSPRARSSKAAAPWWGPSLSWGLSPWWGGTRWPWGRP